MWGFVMRRVIYNSSPLTATNSGILVWLLIIFFFSFWLGWWQSWWHILHNLERRGRRNFLGRVTLLLLGAELPQGVLLAPCNRNFFLFHHWWVQMPSLEVSGIWWPGALSCHMLCKRCLWPIHRNGCYHDLFFHICWIGSFWIILEVSGWF